MLITLLLALEIIHKAAQSLVEDARKETNKIEVENLLGNDYLKIAWKQSIIAEATSELLREFKEQDELMNFDDDEGLKMLRRMIGETKREAESSIERLEKFPAMTDEQKSLSIIAHRNVSVLMKQLLIKSENEK